MTDDELVFLSATEQSELIRRRTISPVELVRACLVRIERYDHALRAYITVCADAALREARAAETEIMAGRYRGALHGLPFGAKDQICTGGIRTTAGSQVYAEHVPDHDATVVTRLKAAGAILIGKENLHELGKGGTNIFPYGQPRNPWNLDRTPSSSSSGSGIAPAAGLCSGSLGEDTGGSIRGPAAANGIVGLRPTYGRVSRYGAIMHAWHSDTIGPLTRTVADNAMFLHAIAGRDERDPLTSARDVPDYQAALLADLRSMHIGVVKEIAYAEGVHGEVATAFEVALDVLRSLGAKITEVTLPWAQYMIPLQLLTSDCEAASMYLPLLRTHWEQLDVGTRTRIASAALVPAVISSRAMRARAVVRSQILAAFEHHDALVTPTHLTPPASIDAARETIESREDVHQRVLLRRVSTHPFGAANVPALAVPMGYTRDGLPLSLQIAGKPFDESTVLRVGHAFEQATAWHLRHPDVEGNVAAYEQEHGAIHGTR